MIDLNLKGTVYVTRAASRVMLARRAGAIVNISSVVGLSGYRGLSVYGATKAALDGLTRALARELGSRGITVNSVAPGYLRTEMSHGLDEDQLGQIARRTPLGRLGEPDDGRRPARRSPDVAGTGRPGPPPDPVTTRTYCTILSTNYLPKALALAESLQEHEDGASLRILFIDHARDDTLPEIPGVECLSTEVLGLPRRTVYELAMAYDLVEFATAVKPLLLRALLQESEQVFYLDPDTYVTSPMDELGPALDASAGGILLTPHFLRAPPPDAEIGDGHMLLVGVHNLGFCGVDRRSGEFLDWWWGHLRTECLYDPLAGLFVDQKWMDIGSTLFEAATFRHSGYNVGVANLSERPLVEDDDGYAIASTGERLRLFHFHAFDSNTPEKLSVRYRHTTDNELQDDSVVLQLCKEYADVLSLYEDGLPPAPSVSVCRGHPRRADLATAASGLSQRLTGQRGTAPGGVRAVGGGRLRAVAPARLAPDRPRASAARPPSASASCCPRNTTP